MLDHRPGDPNRILIRGFRADAVDGDEFNTNLLGYVSSHPASCYDKTDTPALGKDRQEFLCSLGRYRDRTSLNSLVQYRCPICSLETDYAAHPSDGINDEAYLSQRSPDFPP